MGKASRKKKASALPATPSGESGAALFKQNPGVKSAVSRTAVHLLVVIVTGIIIYSNTLHSPFQLDERYGIVQNAIVKDLGYFARPSRAAGLPLYSALKSRYVGYLTFALNYRFNGLDVTGYHIVNIAIHLVNAVLVYLLVLLTFRTPYCARGRAAGGGQRPQEGVESNAGYDLRPEAQDWRPSKVIAFFTALVFVAHPLQTEAVTYVFQRLASLVTTFYLLSVVLYAAGRLAESRARKAGSYFFSFLCVVLAMKTKENAFTLPVVIALYEFLFFGGATKKRILLLVAFLLTMAVIPFTLGGPASVGYREIPRTAYFLTQFRVMVTYLRLLFLPVNQNLDYDYPLYHSLFTPSLFFSFLFLAALFGTAVYMLYATRRPEVVGSSPGRTEAPALRSSGHTHIRLIGFGLLWFFITLSVESSIIPIPMVIDEYRLYLPSVGFFFALTTGTYLAVRHLRERFPAAAKWSPYAAVLVIIGLSCATYARNGVWKDRVSLWEDVVEKSPDKARPLNNLALAYIDTHRLEDALPLLNRAVLVDPQYVEAYNNLADVDIKLGKYDEAKKVLMKALSIAPEFSEAYTNLSFLFISAGQLDRAEEAARKAISLNPESPDAYNNLSTIFRKLGRTPDAIKAAETALGVRPGYAVPYNNLGLAYVAEKRFEEASLSFRKAVDLDPSYAEAYNNLGGLYLTTGKYDEAIAAFSRALEIQPLYSKALFNLGVAYQLKGDRRSAMLQYEKLMQVSAEDAGRLLAILRGK
jgi:tetratricopeptide (TPR) repeat protein